jgi:hypothetical protein
MSNAALNSLLDTLENRYATPRGYTPHAPARNPAEPTAGQRNAPPAPPPERGVPQGAVLSRPATPAPDEDDVSDDDNDLNLNIEDNVIRELARSLRPQRR